jgi:hypothetical protein
LIPALAPRCDVPALTRGDVDRLLEHLNDALRELRTEAELFSVSGTVMCLAYGARPASPEVESWFRPARQIQEAASRVAAQAGVDPDWLDVGVRDYFTAQREFAPFLALDHLRVMSAQPEYLLAMKCLSMCADAEQGAADDVRYLLRHLNIRRYEKAVASIARYYPIERIPQKTLSALAALLPKSSV